jgi:hypothetical protein
MYDHLIYYLIIWHIYPVLVNITDKNLATLERSRWRPEKLLREKKYFWDQKNRIGFFQDLLETLWSILRRNKKNFETFTFIFL